ncbi:MAG: hypothetical protein ACOYBJ_00925 [Patescibacteria group bacterium]|jgi:hypothetical protein
MSEEAMDHILRTAQEDLACPVCGRQFELDELKVRGAFEHQYLIQAACQRGHSPTLTLYVVAERDEKEQVARVTTDEVLDLHAALKGFDGDFKSVFAKLDEKKQS